MYLFLLLFLLLFDVVRHLPNQLLLHHLIFIQILVQVEQGFFAFRPFGRSNLIQHSQFNIAQSLDVPLIFRFRCFGE